MNKKLLAVAVVGALASPLAFAQNTTIYGIIDANLQHADSSQAGTKNFVQSGSWATSRLGLKGSEDIGSGSYVFWQIEHGLSIDTGAQDSKGFWNRQAYIGLGSKAWGELTFGRQYTPLFNQMNGVGTEVIGTLIGTLGIHGELDRCANCVKYSSPSFGGVYFGGSYSTGGNGIAAFPATGPSTPSGESTTSTDDGKYWDAHVGWKGGPFAVNAGHGVLKGDAAAGSSERKTNQLVGKWDNGTFGIAAGWQNHKADSTTGLLATSLGVAQEDDRRMWVQPVFRFGGNNELYGMWSKLKEKVSGPLHGDSTLMGLAYRHLFTKRTYAYASLVKVDNKDQAVLAPYSFAATVAAGTDPKGFNVGIVQEF